MRRRVRSRSGLPKHSSETLMTDSEMVTAAISELRRVDGIMPTVAEYNERRDHDQPPANTLIHRSKLTWQELAVRANLTRKPGVRTDGNGMPAHIMADLQSTGRTCDCGRPATLIGRFATLTATGADYNNGMLLCEGCAKLVDDGVVVVPLYEVLRGVLA